MLQLECKSLGANLRLNKFMEVCIRSKRAVSSNRSAISIILILAIKHIACSCVMVLKCWTIANVMQPLISKLLHLSSLIPSYRKVDHKLNQPMKSMNADQELPLLTAKFHILEALCHCGKLQWCILQKETMWNFNEWKIYPWSHQVLKALQVKIRTSYHSIHNYDWNLTVRPNLQLSQNLHSLPNLWCKGLENFRVPPSQILKLILKTHN